MKLLIVGVVVLVLTIVAFAALLPRGGHTHRFVGTELEPYVAVALTSMVALSFTLMLSGVLNYFG